MTPLSSSLHPQTLALISRPSTHVFFLPSKPYFAPPRISSSVRTTRSPPLLVPISAASNEDSSVSILPFEDLVEKDWSFIDSDTTTPELERAQKAKRVISAADIGEKSRVLVSLGAVGFVDQLVEACPCELLLVIHDSLFVLAEIKEKYDNVRCFQGGIEVVPEKFAPFDVAFICYFPGMGISIERLLGLLDGRCSPGARVVISYDQGRDVIEQVHRRQHPDMVTSDLPCKITLENAASQCSFQITEFIDAPSFYLAVLKFCESGTAL